MNQESVDLNALLYADKLYLAKMAARLGLHNEVGAWRTSAAQLKSKINRCFFDGKVAISTIGKLRRLNNLIKIGCADGQLLTHRGRGRKHLQSYGRMRPMLSMQAVDRIGATVTNSPVTFPSHGSTQQSCLSSHNLLAWVGSIRSTSPLKGLKNGGIANSLKISQQQFIVVPKASMMHDRYAKTTIR